MIITENLLHENKRAAAEAKYRGADYKEFGTTNGSVVSTAEAFSKCGITTTPDELKKLEDTAENASFTELISKEELRDLLGKAVGATLVGALRKYIRDQEGEEPDSSSPPEDDTYSYVSQDPAQRVLEAYNSSLKALWQQNLGAREFSTLIQLFDLQESVARLFQSYFVTLDSRACILIGLYTDGLADPSDANEQFCAETDKDGLFGNATLLALSFSDITDPISDAASGGALDITWRCS